MKEEELILSFIKSDKSPEGKWFIEVPAGIKVQEERETDSSSIKQVDAVCLTSKSEELPKKYKRNLRGRQYYINPDGVDPESEYMRVLNGIPHKNKSKTDIFRGIIESPYMDDETATIVEAKTGKSSFEAIGQLEAYKVLVEEDYGWDVNEQILLCEERDEVIDRVCGEINIRHGEIEL